MFKQKSLQKIEKSQELKASSNQQYMIDLDHSKKDQFQNYYSLVNEYDDLAHVTQ